MVLGDELGIIFLVGYYIFVTYSIYKRHTGREIHIDLPKDIRYIP